jgi:hypothetical protein
LFSFIKNIFGQSIPNIDAPIIGSLKYDREEKYWELVRSPKDLINGLDFNFCCITGGIEGPSSVHIEEFTRLIRNPDLLWGFINSKVIEKASKDILGVTESNVREYFYIRSFTFTNENEFELGFHARNIDMFIELFIVGNSITNIEKDVGCCTV